MTRYFILRVIKFIIGAIIIVSIFHEAYEWKVRDMLIENNIGIAWLDSFQAWLNEHGILIITDNFWLKALLLIILLLVFPGGKTLLLFLLRKASRVFKMLPGKQTSEIIKRYINIVRYARYTRQSDIFTKLTNQYPAGSGMIVLPMDMEFMGAGRPMKTYGEQMSELAKLKENRPEQIYPFVFVDPRRTHVGEQIFFNYEVVNGKVVLKDCFIKDYIETKEFSGFKIYPALGYFPFDETLLPLWKYAADNGIPIMTHCIRGVIYYRGKKKKVWDQHPIFKQSMAKDNDQDDDANGKMQDADDFQPMLLPQMKMVDLQEVFTHPLNYLCLLDQELLAQLVGQSKNKKLKELFGYNEQSKSITRDLKDLKICFGHFGGDDEWTRFFEKDRDNYGSQLVKRPTKGINFLRNAQGDIKLGKPEQIWKSADWYSIICSLMLQYDHIYADISYILHSDSGILPLLKQTMKHDTLKTRVLYGSDFYVVRNHKSDKNMLTNMSGGLTKEEFDQMAGTNPLMYLKRK